ncbi:MAG: cysteine desulfurase family protein [Chthonomonadales bacterium]
MTKLPIYLDNNATTPMDQRVLEAMIPYFTEHFGNAASSGHVFGRTARAAVEKSRAQIARCLHAASPLEIVFTSGATESDNLAIKGAAELLQEKGRHLITSLTEHKAVIDSYKHLEKLGWSVTYLGVDETGMISLAELKSAIRPDTVLVSIMAGNNEIGVLQDIQSIGTLCREEGVLFHTDATQAIGKVPFDVRDMNVDMASFTAHKIYGPKGSGGLYVRHQSGLKLVAQMDGGGHENGYRSGTLNVAGIVGLATALQLCMEDMPAEIDRLVYLRTRLHDGLKEKLGDVCVNGHESRRLPGHMSIALNGINGETLMMMMPEVAISSVSACSSGSGTTSHVLSALGASEERALSTLRFGIGRFNDRNDIDYAVDRIAEHGRTLRAARKASAG